LTGFVYADEHRIARRNIETVIASKQQIVGRNEIRSALFRVIEALIRREPAIENGNRMDVAIRKEDAIEQITR